MCEFCSVDGTCSVCKAHGEGKYAPTCGPVDDTAGGAGALTTAALAVEMGVPFGQVANFKAN